MLLSNVSQQSSGESLPSATCGQRSTLLQGHNTLSGDAMLVAADLGRAVGAMSALALEPASMAASFGSTLGTDRDEFGHGAALDGSLHNFTIAFPQAPDASAGWRWGNCQNFLCLHRVSHASPSGKAHPCGHEARSTSKVSCASSDGFLTNAMHGMQLERIQSGRHAVCDTTDRWLHTQQKVIPLNALPLNCETWFPLKNALPMGYRVDCANLDSNGDISRAQSQAIRQRI